MKSRRLILIAALFALAALYGCGPKDNAPAPEQQAAREGDAAPQAKAEPPAVGANEPMEKPKELTLPPLPILGPTALTGDPGDGRAYLRWNLQIEDDRVVGWKVKQLKPAEKLLTREMLTDREYVVRDLVNGTACTFAVVGILKDRKETPPSNTAAVTPADVGTAKIAEIKGQKITVGEFKDIGLSPEAVKAIFPDGQELIFDRLRPVDWKTRDGEHMIYPVHFGNGLDIGKFDKRGLPMIIPPGGIKRDTITVGDQTWTTSPPTGSDNFSIRWTGFILPKFSEAYTFHATTDEGVRLWIGDDLVINNWTNKPFRREGRARAPLREEVLHAEQAARLG